MQTPHPFGPVVLRPPGHPVLELGSADAQHGGRVTLIAVPFDEHTFDMPTNHYVEPLIMSDPHRRRLMRPDRAIETAFLKELAHAKHAAR